MPQVQPFQRSPQDQRAFDRAKVILHQHDPYVDPVTGVGSMHADLVLEGGGVKGIGLVGAMLVLNEAGYDFPASPAPAPGPSSPRWPPRSSSPVGASPCSGTTWAPSTTSGSRTRA